MHSRGGFSPTCDITFCPKFDPTQGHIWVPLLTGLRLTCCMSNSPDQCPSLGCLHRLLLHHATNKARHWDARLDKNQVNHVYKNLMEFSCHLPIHIFFQKDFTSLRKCTSAILKQPAYRDTESRTQPTQITITAPGTVPSEPLRCGESNHFSRRLRFTTTKNISQITMSPTCDKCGRSKWPPSHQNKRPDGNRGKKNMVTQNNCIFSGYIPNAVGSRTSNSQIAPSTWP